MRAATAYAFPPKMNETRSIPLQQHHRARLSCSSMKSPSPLPRAQHSDAKDASTFAAVICTSNSQIFFHTLSFPPSAYSSVKPSGIQISVRFSLPVSLIRPLFCLHSALFSHLPPSPSSSLSASALVFSLSICESSSVINPAARLRVCVCAREHVYSFCKMCICPCEKRSVLNCIECALQIFKYLHLKNCTCR